MTVWDDNAKLYDSEQSETGDFLHKFMIDPELAKLLVTISGKVILDAGCGNGYWVRKLSSAKTITGIDSSKRLIQLAKSRKNPKNVQFLIADLQKRLPFKDNYFDVILSSMVLQYLPSIGKTAAEFHRILKNGGQVIIAVQHPIFQYHFRAKGLPKPFLKTSAYFEKKSIQQQIMGGKAIATIFNRPLDEYMTSFLQNGFILNAFVEPEYSDKLLKAKPSYRKISEVPRVAIMRFEKVNLS